MGYRVGKWYIFSLTVGLEVASVVGSRCIALNINILLLFNLPRYLILAALRLRIKDCLKLKPYL